jgi:hypothetical protein
MEKNRYISPFPKVEPHKEIIDENIDSNESEDIYISLPIPCWTNHKNDIKEIGFYNAK